MLYRITNGTCKSSVESKTETSRKINQVKNAVLGTSSVPCVCYLFLSIPDLTDFISNQPAKHERDTLRIFTSKYKTCYLRKIRHQLYSKCSMNQKKLHTCYSENLGKSSKLRLVYTQFARSAKHEQMIQSFALI